MSNYSEVAAILTDSLLLNQAPVAVSLADSLPEGVPLFDGRVAAGCQFWQLASTQTFATTAVDHARCAIGIYTHSLEHVAGVDQDLGDALKVFADLGYVRSEDLAAIPVLPVQPKYVVYGPLSETTLKPDVVLLFVKADQTLILSEATQQVEGSWAPALGRPACAIVPQAKNSGRTALSLGCCGARAYVDSLTPDVALYALPGANVEAYAERIAALGKANALLTQFHTLRRQDVEAGGSPTVQESLARLQG